METPMTQRPNILVVMADQLNPAFLPVYGHPLVKTPHLSALAARGTVFDSAYCNSPLCSPSRGVLMTGQLPSRTGIYDNAAEFRADIPTFAHYLRALGYRTVLSGKMHFCGPDQLHGFEERLTTDIYPADYGWTPDWEQPQARPQWYHNMSSVTQAGLCVRTNQLDFDDEVTFAATRALYEHVRSPDKRPFCLVASLTHPHDPFAITREYWDLYDHADIDMPRVTSAPDDPHSARLRHVFAMPDAALSDGDIRNARHAYYGEISCVDSNLGKMLQALRDTGLYDNTVIVFASDHGEMLGERGLWYKMNYFEGAARVPLIVAGVRGAAARRVKNCVSLADLLPTLVELGGGDLSALLGSAIDGRSLVPHIAGKGGHDEVIGEYFAEGAIAPMIMVRRGSMKFIHAPGDPAQLYDLSRDPDELNNLAGDAAHCALLEELRAFVEQRWDLPKLDREVRDSQRRRRVVDHALTQGVPRPWDFQPFRDAAKSYVRNTIPLDDLEAMARFPKAGQE